MKQKIQIGAGIISLSALLTYTLIHTGGLLARYINPSWAGYIAATGIEVAIVSLSLRIGDLRKSGLSIRWFLFVLVSVVVVSALANVAEGFSTAQKLPLTISNVQQLDPVQAVIGLSATGLISLIVLALSEIIGSDVQTLAAAVERDRRKTSKNVEIDEPISRIEQARQIDLANDADNKQRKIQGMIDIYRTNPNAKPLDVYKPLNLPRATFYSYLNELEQSGQISRNGKGVIVK